LQLSKESVGNFEIVNIGQDRQIVSAATSGLAFGGLTAMTEQSCDALASRVREVAARFQDSQARAAYLLCDQHAPQKVAYRVVSQQLSATDLTYGDLREQSERLASALSAAGIRSGDRVATLMGKSPDYVIAIMAIWRLGAVHVPLFTAFAVPAIAERLTRSGAKIVFCDRTQQCKLAPSDTIPASAPWRVITTATSQDMMPNAINFAELLAAHQPGFQAVALGGDAPIIEIYTSGTTGRPKGVVVPLKAAAGFQLYGEFAFNLRADDIFWNAADPGWAYGLYFGILTALTTGVMGILLEGGFSIESTLAVLSQYAVTNFAAAPTVYRSLRASGLSPPSALKLRSASSAGEPLTPEINEWAVVALGVEVHDHYGQTEAGMLINNHHHPALHRSLRPGSMGHPMPGWAAVILKHDRDELAPTGQIGRVAIDIAQSPLAWFQGYVDDAAKSAEKFSADGRWYITGDVGRVDDEGYYYFSARDDDIIIMAGYRIGPFEVESVIATHPAVSECAVVGVPDAIRGEVLEAVVVLREGRVGCAALTDELQTWVRSRYASHAYPRHVHYVDSLPKTPSGKIQRVIVRQQLRQRVDA
jgi:acetyl-CoA synthetase